MPIGTRLSTPIPRSYLHDERLNSIADPLAREGFLRAKLVCDNRGRLPGNPAMLAGILWPANPPKAAKMSQIIESWSRAGLVFHYSAGTRSFIEITDNGTTSRLVGNMSDQSEYPSPPQELVDKWAKEFGCEWKPIARSGNTSKDDVRPRSNGSTHVPTRIAEEKRVVGSVVEEKRDELVGSRPDLTDSVDLEDKRFDPDQPTNVDLLAKLFKAVSHGKWVGTKQFQRVVLFKLSELKSLPKNPKDLERLLSVVMDECDSRGSKYKWPREWREAIEGLRKQLKERAEEEDDWNIPTVEDDYPPDYILDMKPGDKMLDVIVNKTGERKTLHETAVRRWIKTGWARLAS